VAGSSAGRTVEERVADWFKAYQAIAAEVSPQALRDQLNAVINTPIPQDPDGIVVYTARMNASMALARLVSANDRASATVAALITATGIKPAAIDYGDDT
jgi:hypothetical protein